MLRKQMLKVHDVIAIVVHNEQLFNYNLIDLVKGRNMMNNLLINTGLIIVREVIIFIIKHNALQVTKKS